MQKNISTLLRFILIAAAITLAPMCAAICAEKSIAALSKFQERISLLRTGNKGRPAPLKIDEAKIGTQKEALAIADKAYTHKLWSLPGEPNQQATEMPTEIAYFAIGYEIPDFAKAGDTLWEVRYQYFGRTKPLELRAVIWVNSRTGDTYCVSGAWQDPQLLL